MEENVDDYEIFDDHEILDPLTWDPPISPEMNFNVCFNKPITFEQDGQFNVYNFKICVSPRNEPVLEKVRIELTREDDLFFLAVFELDEDGFQLFKKSQHWIIAFRIS